MDSPSPLPPVPLSVSLPVGPPRVQVRWLAEAARLLWAQAGVWVGTAWLLLLLSGAITLGVAFVMGSETGSGSSSSASGPWSEFWMFLLGWDVVHGLAHILVCGAFAGPLAHMAVRQVQGETITVRDLFGFRAAARAAGSGAALPLFMLFVQILTVAGLLCLLVPGLLLTALLLPVRAGLARGLGVSAALAGGVSAVGRGWLHAVGLVLLLALLVALGTAPFLLGLVVVQPLLWLVGALADRDLVLRPAQQSAPAAGYGDALPGVWPPPPSAPDVLR